MKKIILTLFIFTLFFVLSGCGYKIVKVDKTINSDPAPTVVPNQEPAPVTNKTIDSQPKCAAAAETFYINNGYKEKTGLSFSYNSHFNSKLDKCFILISAVSSKNDALFVDLYDVLEKKHYASFIGHNNCDPTSLVLSNNPNKCLIDSGNVWFDGNDLRNPADFHTGFNGMIKGGSGNENTFKQFMAYVNPFMNN